MIKDIIGLRRLTTTISKAMANYICYDQDETLFKYRRIKIFLKATKYISMVT